MKKLSKKDREQLVELLRCAADELPRSPMPVGSAVQALDLPDDPWYALALDLEELVEPGSSWDAEARQHALLEAALRLEQGDLP